MGFLGNVWFSIEFSIYALARQAQHENLDWLKDDSGPEPGVEVYRRNEILYEGGIVKGCRRIDSIVPRPTCCLQQSERRKKT